MSRSKRPASPPRYEHFSFSASGGPSSSELPYSFWRIRLVFAQDSWIPYTFLMPVLVSITGIILVPLIYGMRMSLTDAAILGPTAPFRNVGLANYVRLLKDPTFWESLKTTLAFSAGSVAGGLFVGLITALVLHQEFRGRAVARALIILPWGVPHVVAALVWVWMYDPQYGVINYFLSALHLVKKNPSWLSDPSLALPAILLLTIWKQYPFSTLMLLAGLQSIPKDLYEAAEMDGAGKVRQFFDITLPSLRHVSNIVILLLTIWSFGNFVFIFLMTQGGPVHTTETLVIKVYLEAFKYFRAGYAFTLGTTLLALALLITAMYIYLVRRPQPV